VAQIARNQYDTALRAGAKGFVIGQIDCTDPGARGTIECVVLNATETLLLRRLRASAHHWPDSDAHIYHNTLTMPVDIGEKYIVKETVTVPTVVTSFEFVPA
jgi:hypothetical protein